MARSKITNDEWRRGADLGRALQAERTSKKKSQGQIADGADVPVDTLRRIEQGKVANPGVFTIAAIASALGRPLAWFVKPPRQKRR